MDHTVKNKHFPGVFEATPLRAPVRPWGHAPRQANPVLTQGRRGAQGRDTPPIKKKYFRRLKIGADNRSYQSADNQTTSVLRYNTFINMKVGSEMEILTL